MLNNNLQQGPNPLELDPIAPFSLGFKELLFLATILFIGFCGFNVCVDKIYAAPDQAQIHSITVYQKDFSYQSVEKRETATALGYAIR